MNISVVNISQGPHELNKESLKELELNQLTFNITSRLRYSSESDYVGFQIDMLIMREKTEIFRSGFLVGLSVDGWSRDLKNGLDLNKNRDKLHSISKTVWLVATGIVALQTSNVQFGGIILPEIDYKAFSSDVLLISTD